MTENNGYCLNWDSEIENDGPEYVLLPEGDYDFTVTAFERGRYEGGSKLPPCSMAKLTLAVEDTALGTANVTHRLYLHSRTEGLLCAFFTSIGQRKHGERIRMDWNRVIGAKGRAHVAVREYTNDKGETRQTNEIKKFYEPDTPEEGSTYGKFTPGQF